jgi:hypothetical protein
MRGSFVIDGLSITTLVNVSACSYEVMPGARRPPAQAAHDGARSAGNGQEHASLADPKRRTPASSSHGGGAAVRRYAHAYVQSLLNRPTACKAIIRKLQLFDRTQLLQP